MSDEKRGYILPTEIDPTDSVDVCVNIPDDPAHIRAFLGQLDYLAYWWTWERDPLKRGTEAARVWRRVVADVRQRLDDSEACGVNMILRQNPSDTCQLQYSMDDGETWELAFDYGLCIPAWAQTLVESADAAQRDRWRDVTSPIDINPYAPTQTFGSRETDTPEQAEVRVNALCYAVRQTVDAIAEAVIGAYTGQITVINMVSAGLGIAATVAGALGVTAWVGLGLGLAAAGLKLLVELGFHDVEIFQDEDTKEFLSCAIFQSLVVRPVTLIAFQTAIDYPVDCASDDENRALYLASRIMADVDNSNDLFTSFVSMLGTANLAAQAGLVGESCVCLPRTWTYCLDMNDWFYLSSPERPNWSFCGQPPAYNSINGGRLDTESVSPVWESVIIEGNQPMLARSIEFFVPASTTVTLIQMHWNWTGGGNTDAVQKYLIVDNVTSCFSIIPNNPIGLAPVDGSGRVIKATFGIKSNITGDTRKYQITGITIHGTGVPLFGICDNC